jgi:hypothetical protein
MFGWLVLPTSEFGPQDSDIIRSVKGEPDPTSSGFDHGERNAFVDDDLFADFPAQNQHGHSSMKREWVILVGRTSPFL